MPVRSAPLLVAVQFSRRGTPLVDNQWNTSFTESNRRCLKIVFRGGRREAMTSPSTSARKKKRPRLSSSREASSTPVSARRSSAASATNTPGSAASDDRSSCGGSAKSSRAKRRRSTGRGEFERRDGRGEGGGGLGVGARIFSLYTRKITGLRNFGRKKLLVILLFFACSRVSSSYAVDRSLSIELG